MSQATIPETNSRQTLIAASASATNVGFAGADNFALTIRAADVLSKSELVPDSFRGEKGFPNCVVALELASRLQVSWLAVMQNLYVVHGRPAWMSTFVIAFVNGSGRFNSLRFDLQGAGETRQCIAWTTEKNCTIPANIRTLADAIKANLPVLESTPITWKMAVAEGWTKKSGSKWLTMPDQMFRYRAAAFWGRTYAPELLMGIVTKEEAEDMREIEATATPIPNKRQSLRVDISQQNGNGEHKEEEPPPTKADGEIIPTDQKPEPKPEPQKKNSKASTYATTEQILKIEAEITRTGWTLPAVRRMVTPTVQMLDQLTSEQAEKVLAELGAKPTLPQREPGDEPEESDGGA